MINSLTLVLSGQAGQGLKTIETLLINAIKEQYHVFSTTEVMSRVRGGNNTVEIRISDTPVYAYKDTIDVLFLLNNHAFNRLPHRITPTTLVFGENTFLSDDEKLTLSNDYTELPISQLAKESGSVLFSNTILFGFISGMLSLNSTIGKKLLEDKFKKKSETVIQGNINAFNTGFTAGSKYAYINTVSQSDENQNCKILNGTDAISIGALAGGVNYVASYPMSPATGVLQYLAAKGNDFEIVVEQAEDEIAALNMVIGGWYAGARALTTTSGGGFALMEEAVSLSGITETPCVIHVAQRPGPGTGLPTRTEQGDLNLVVYSGHGEFPRIVLAPGNLEDGVLLTQKAFHLADKYQVPVFVLSDQYYLDSQAPIKPIELPTKPLESFVIESKKDYLRYNLSHGPISPRAIPGYGQGLVKCDSDEHDEEGTITEDFNMRILMNDKRLAKESLILDDYIKPELIGSKDYERLIIGWGSTYGVIKEAVESSSEKVAFLHLKQVYPLSQDILNYIHTNTKVSVIENNATGQLSDLLSLRLGLTIDDKYVKYNGVPFTIEEIDAYIKEVF